MKLGRRIHLIIFILLCALFILFLSRLDLAKVSDALVGVSWGWVILAALLNMFNTWVEAFRWKLILSSIKKKAHHHVAFAGILVGVVGNVLLPLKVGDAARAYFVSRKEGIYFASTLSSVILDRMVDITSFLVLVSITLVFFNLQLSFKHINILILLALVAILLTFFVLIKFGRKLKLKFKKRFSQAIVEQINRFAVGLSALRDAKILLPTIILSAISWGMKSGIVWLMFKAFGFKLPLFSAITTLILINLGISILNTPANFGGFEFSAVAALHLFSIESELAVSYAVVLHLVEVVPIVLMGLAVIWISEFDFKLFKTLSESAKEGNGGMVYDIEQQD
jgi:glycosyltransferase 2 family protein